jgi:hypothetical protein
MECLRHVCVCQTVSAQQAAAVEEKQLIED